MRAWLWPTVIVSALFVLSFVQVYSALGYGRRAVSNNNFNSSITQRVGSVLINDDAAETESRDVVLTMSVSDATQMAISNTDDFSASSFVPYASQYPWTLSDGEGAKTVFVRFVNASGGSATANDSIVLRAGAAPAPAPSAPATLNCDMRAFSAYRATGSRSVYYVTSQNTKSAFRSAPVFFSYFESWGDVRETTQACLDGVANDNLGFMAWGPLRNLVNGDIVKSPDDPRVYIMVNNKLHWIASEDVFLALYGSWSVVEDVDARLIAAYELGSEIATSDMHPDGTLVKVADDPKVYMIENGLYRWVETEEAFNRLGYRWDRIFTVASIPADKLGDPIQ